MSEANIQAEFTFENFKVLKSNLIFPEYSISPSFNIDIEPKGVFSNSSMIYTLELKLIVQEQDGREIINIISQSEFLFKGEFDEIPPYFTLNAPAIAYPYLRAYVSGLTSLSGMSTIGLPIMNLVSLAENLKKNFSRVD